MKVHPGKDKNTASRRVGKTLETQDTLYKTNTRHAKQGNKPVVRGITTQ